MHVLVTGAAGFIGSTLVDRLLREGLSVTAYDNFSTGQPRFLTAAHAQPNFRLVRGDTLDLPALTEAMRGAELVFHLAANADVRFGTEHPRKDLEQNTIATFNVLEAMRATSARRVAFDFLPGEYAVATYYLVATAEASSNLARFDGVRYGLRVDAPTTNEMMVATRTAGFGAEVKRRIMLGTYALSAGYYDAFYGKAQKVRTLICRDFAAAYERFDVLLSPTTPTTAFEVGAIHDPLTMYLNDICTIPTNLAGDAAMSVPFGTDGAGLPVGVQVLAPALGEVAMFRTAAAVEAAAPTSGKDAR